MNSKFGGKPVTRKIVKPEEETSSALQQAIDFGIDVSLLAANLRLSPQQRVEQHQRNLRMAELLREAVKPCSCYALSKTVISRGRTSTKSSSLNPKS